MRNIYLFLLITLLAAGTSPSLAQVNIPIFSVLEVRPDAHSTMNAGALTGIPSDIPAAFYYNPAQLGNYGTQNRISAQFFPGGNNWIYDNISWNTSALTGGYAFKKIPLGVGLSVMNAKMDYGRLENRNLEGGSSIAETYDQQSSIGVGLSYDLGVMISAGYTYKWMNTKTGDNTISGDAFDLGVLAAYEQSIEQFNLGFSLGYSIRNEGDLISFTYEDPQPIGPHEIIERKASLPRSRVFGYGLSLGFQEMVRNQLREIIKAEWSVDAKESVLRRSDRGDILYPSTLDLAGNLFTARTGQDIVISQGLKTTFFESVTVGLGRYYGSGFDKPVQTYGFAIGLNPLATLFIQNSSNAALDFLIHHVDIRYAWSTYDQFETLEGTSLSGFTLTIYGF
jgi:hypothetical protein